MKKLILLSLLIVMPLLAKQSPVTVPCSDVDIRIFVGQKQTTVQCVPPTLPPTQACEPPALTVVVSGWPRTDAQSTRFSYDPSEPVRASFDPQAGTATFTAVRDSRCVAVVRKP